MAANPPIGQMPGILDWLLGSPPTTPETGPGIPSANPLRKPAPAPQPGAGFLDSLLQGPSMGGLTFGLTGDSPAVTKLKGDKAEAEARRYYNAPQGDVPLPERKDAKSEEAPTNPDEAVPGEDEEGEVPPLPEKNPFAGGGVGGGTTRGPDGQVRVPVGQSSPVADPFKAMMMQIGLSLMTPSWGNSLSQIGQAVGGGVGAAGRAAGINEAEDDRQRNIANQAEDRALKAQKTGADVEESKAKAGLYGAQAEDLQSGESSRSKRLKGKQPTNLDEAAAAANLGPKGKLYLSQRIKTLNAEDILGTGDSDPTEKFNQILAEAQKLDVPVKTPAAPNVGGTETIESLPLVKTPADAKKLKSGTKFLFEQNGRIVRGTAP